MPKHVTVDMLDIKLKQLVLDHGTPDYRIRDIAIPEGTTTLTVQLPDPQPDDQYDVLIPLTDWFTAIAVREKTTTEVILDFWMAPPYDTTLDIRIAR
jgi:hypothetical protein